MKFLSPPILTLIFICISCAHATQRFNLKNRCSAYANYFSSIAVSIVNSKGEIEESCYINSSKESLFDLASLTKLYTAYLTLRLHDQNFLQISDHISKYSIHFSQSEKSKIKFSHLLQHESGLPIVNSEDDFSDDLNTTWETIFSYKLNYSPSSKFAYSDVGFLVLGHLIEIITNQSLDNAMNDHVFKTLGLNQTNYNPKAEYAIATSDQNIGIVHDPRSQKLKGISGHAGIFSTLEDVSKFVHELSVGKYLSQDIHQQMQNPSQFGRGLGVDIASAYSPSLRGSYFKEGSGFGHSGYTGTSLWVDQESGYKIVILTNRVYPDDSLESKRKIKEFRRFIADLVGLELNRHK